MTNKGLLPYINECVANILYGELTADQTVAVSPNEKITKLKGSHRSIIEG
jgi:hypothetical protein